MLCPKAILKEHVSCDDCFRCFRPDDVYHPDFQYSCPAYFDLSVRSTTQPSYISSSSCTRVAAVIKGSEGYQDVVEEAGCDFIPLLVETFGVWSPSAVRMLKTVSNRTTTQSGSSSYQTG